MKAMLSSIPVSNPERQHFREPLPEPASTHPRRRQTIVCRNLRVDGQSWDNEDARLHAKDAIKGGRADFQCRRRPGSHLAADFVIDICLSSWRRNCLFLSDDGPTVSAGTGSRSFIGAIIHATQVA